MSSPSALLPRNGVLFRLTLLFLPVAGLFTAIILPVLHSYEEGRISIIKARESGYLNVATRLIRNEFHRSISDLQTFLRDPLLQQYLDGGMAKHREELAQLLEIHAQGYKRYDQIRLLNVKGHEVIRINYRDGSSINIPKAELQDKSQRYYFIEASKLEQNEVYVSPIDLNVEYGKVEMPFKPTIRFAAPLFDSSGRRTGVLVLNYHASILLQAFHNDMEINPLHQPMLLNPSGYWISHPQREREWGFMLSNNNDRFSVIHPSAWEYINQTMQGEFETDEGLLLFSTVYPLQNDPEEFNEGDTIENIGNQRIRDYYWKIVIFIPGESLFATSFIRNSYGGILLVAIYILLAVLAYLIALFSLLSKQRLDKERVIAREIEDLYNLAPCGYHSLDQVGLIIKMNQTELNWLGYSADEIIGKKSYAELLTASSQVAFRSKFRQFLLFGEVHDVELEVVRRDGSILPIMVSATAIRDDRNNIVMSRSTVFDMTERKRLEERLVQQATTDFLTGLNNRRHFYQLAGLEISRAKRTGKPLSLLLMDIDHFKQLNDTHGHHAGDIALQTFSALCQKELRDIDILGRIGGEEFTALLPDTNGDVALEVAQRLCNMVASTPVTISVHTDINITVSIGVTTHIQSDNGVEDMLRRADKAMYTAKHSGRNQVCCKLPAP